MHQISLRRIPVLLVICGTVWMFACIQPGREKKEPTAGEAQEWTVLFDGTTAESWRGYNEDELPEGWKVEDGTLMSTGSGGDIGGDIVYDRPFENFILSLEWKISPGGNSGIFYHVKEGDQYRAAYETGPEYQLIDDADFPQPLKDWQKTGADYAMHPADTAEKILYEAGQWNSSKIVFNKGYAEHWLNGKKVVAFTAWDEAWHQKVQESKWRDFPDYGRARTGLIGLQDHGSPIWFRNIRIKEL